MKNSGQKVFRLVLCTAGASDRISKTFENIEVQCVKTLWHMTCRVAFDVEKMTSKFFAKFAKNLVEKVFRLDLCTAGASERISKTVRNIEGKSVIT